MSMFNKLTRLKRIVEELNKSYESDLRISVSTLRNRVNTKISVAKCKSTYEKDLESLKVDFDIQFTTNLRGVMLLEKVNFIEKLNTILK